MNSEYKIRPAETKDIKVILFIYNQGIEDRIATLEEKQKDMQQQ
ncbi:hypothetical protein [Neobacillus paridis]|nr:hypothetical protein [Neobacillus paridis]